MKIPNNVRAKNIFWNIIPWLSNSTAQAIYPNIYVPKSMYDNLTSPKPNKYNVARLIHEQEHIKRQKLEGPFIWSIKYIFFAKFRFNEEILADVPKFRYLKINNLDPYISVRAKQLSGWVYFWPVKYEYAYSRLKQIWMHLN